MAQSCRTLASLYVAAVEPLRNKISIDLVRLIAHHLRAARPAFDTAGLIETVTPQLDTLELKARVQLVADAIAARLPLDPASRIDTLRAVLHPEVVEDLSAVTDERGVAGWGIWPLTTVVADRGLDDFEASLALLRDMTRRSTAEFAVRAFLAADLDRALAVMRGWIDDPCHHVRRLVSEGTRPRLPWGRRLNALCADPTPVLPLLERLRDDPSDYVRRSVANHLNDVAKDHPDLALDVLETWAADAPPPRLKLIRHAARTLLKAGHPRALSLHGFHPLQADVSPIILNRAEVRVGDNLTFTCALTSTTATEQRVAIDYAVHYRKRSGTLAPKVFKGTTATLAARGKLTFRKTHRFRDVTTRTHHPGAHALSLRINGRDTPAVPFELLG